MKRVVLSLMAAALLLPAIAQQYVIVNDGIPILADNIEGITYESDDQFLSNLLPGRLASDPKNSLFSKALELTGLADTLRLYWKPDYQPIFEKYYYNARYRNEVADFDTVRVRRFTVFAETDDVYAAQGINSIDDLKAYAKRVYDEVYPEDAAVSDPTDRRHSLNRFVAYHILGHGGHYYHLTGEDGHLMSHFYDRDKADITAWYATLMPQSSLKCSFPVGEGSGVYLNHRGLKDGPDKYGCQVRGAKIVADASDMLDDQYTHTAFNGYYFHIDRLLAYDQQTREQVLGSERWRVDFITLSPDILNVDTRKREYIYDDGIDSGSSIVRYSGHAFAWDIENFWTEKSQYPLIARRSHCNFWDYEGDEMLVFEDFDFTVKLPPLPPGEWEIRLGCCCLDTNPKITVYINGQQTCEEIDMSQRDYSDMPYTFMPGLKLNGPNDCGFFQTIGPTYVTEFRLFSDNTYVRRTILGRVKTDGKTDTYLRLACKDPESYDMSIVMPIDFLEFCPVSICDNKEIPED